MTLLAPRFRVVATDELGASHLGPTGSGWGGAGPTVATGMRPQQSPRAPYTWPCTWGIAMAQITLYIDSATQARLREVAARRQVSQSQFVAELIRRAIDDCWPEDVLALAGSVPDFPDAKALRASEVADAPRAAW